MYIYAQIAIKITSYALMNESVGGLLSANAKKVSADANSSFTAILTLHASFYLSTFAPKIKRLQR
jgi:hypothetical protein